MKPCAHFIPWTKKDYIAANLCYQYYVLYMHKLYEINLNGTTVIGTSTAMSSPLIREKEK